MSHGRVWHSPLFLFLTKRGREKAGVHFTQKNTRLPFLSSSSGNTWANISLASFSQMGFSSPSFFGSLVVKCLTNIFSFMLFCPSSSSPKSKTSCLYFCKNLAALQRKKAFVLCVGIWDLGRGLCEWSTGCLMLEFD